MTKQKSSVPFAELMLNYKAFLPLFDFRTVVFPEEVPQPIINGMKNHMKQKQKQLPQGVPLVSMQRDIQAT
jgi:hypothetical protein